MERNLAREKKLTTVHCSVLLLKIGVCVCGGAVMLIVDVSQQEGRRGDIVVNRRIGSYQ